MWVSVGDGVSVMATPAGRGGRWMTLASLTCKISLSNIPHTSPMCILKAKSVSLLTAWKPQSYMMPGVRKTMPHRPNLPPERRLQVTIPQAKSVALLPSATSRSDNRKQQPLV